jgi:hypothetical protein
LIKLYKRILRRIVKKEVAQQWLAQVEELLEIINDNSK